MPLIKDLQRNLPTSKLPESDEERFKVPDKLSEMPLSEAALVIEKQYLLCKKNRLPPSSDQWMLWSAVFIRSWIARIQSEPDHPHIARRKALFVLWWNRGAALKHYADSASRMIRKGKAAGIHKDCELLKEQVTNGSGLNERQLAWIENAYNTMLPLVKKQILATIPVFPQEKAENNSPVSA